MQRLIVEARTRIRREKARESRTLVKMARMWKPNTEEWRDFYILVGHGVEAHRALRFIINRDKRRSVATTAGDRKLDL